MAEVAAVVESVVGIAAVGVKLAKTLYQVGHRTASADHNVNRIAAHAAHFSSTLQRVATLLQSPRPLHSPAALDALAHIVRESEAVFQDFTTIVIHARDKGEAVTAEPVPANGGRRRHSIVTRVKWYFEQPYVESLTAQLAYLAATLAALAKTLDLAEAAYSAHGDHHPAAHAPPSLSLNQERMHLETLIVAQQYSVVLLKDAQDRHAHHQASLTDETLAEIERSTEQRYPKLLTQNQRTTIDPIRLCDDEMEFLDHKSSPSADEEPGLEPTLSRSDRLVDGILHKWTSLPADRLPHPSMSDALEVALYSSGEHTPDRGVDPASSSHNSLLQPGYSTAPSTQWLAPGGAPPRSTRSPQPGSNRLVSEPPRSRTPNTAQVGQHPTATDQVLSTPSLYTPQPPPLPRSFTGAVDSLPGALGHPTAPRIHSHHHHSSNYKKPHVSSGSSSESSSDSEDASKPADPRKDSVSSKHGHHDSGIGDGLGIPWRIRISASKYFDFRDEKLVGPRTPYLPSEPRSWMYSHDNAKTEVSKKWVCEEAIAEKRYAYCDVREELQSGAALGGEEGAWRILQPLRFAEVEALVTRTIECFKQQSAAQSASPPAPSPIPIRTPQPYLRGQSYYQAGHSSQHPPQHRSVSFNEGLAPTTPTEYRPPRSPAAPYAPLVLAHSGPPPSSPTLAMQTRAPQSPHEWREPHRDNFRDGRRDRDRGSHDRDRDRERPGSHSGKHRHRDKDRREEKKKAAGTIPVTIAKIGGLAALLEGLDF